MANLVHKRVSADQQSTTRQNLVLDETEIEDPVDFEEDPGTSSLLHPLQCPKFQELLTYARPGDTVHISEMFHLARGTGTSSTTSISSAATTASVEFRPLVERIRRAPWHGRAAGGEELRNLAFRGARATFDAGGDAFARFSRPVVENHGLEERRPRPGRP
ncbi:hypothetical protein GCM10010433_23820 [Streptomyces pulveraceus]|uniref:Uncharacterized protein n=1 Tax=Streptomyces pulveraceus TaxID=68258 RepID=A0ABW1GHB8_9ACTN